MRWISLESRGGSGGEGEGGIYLVLHARDVRQRGEVAGFVPGGFFFGFGGGLGLHGLREFFPDVR